MNRKNRLQRVLGSEDMVPLPDVPGADHAMVVESTELAQAELEMVRHDAALDQTTSDLYRVEEKAEYLQERLDGLEAMMNGSRDWNGALAQSLYQDCQRVLVNTFDKPLNAVMGTESLDDDDSTKQQLISGCEGIKEGIKKFALAAKKFFEELFNSVINFFKGFFDALHQQEIRADRLLAKLEKISPTRLKDEIQVGPWNAYVNITQSGKSADPALGLSAKPLIALERWLKDQSHEQALGYLHGGLTAFAKEGNATRGKSDDNTEEMKVRLGGVDYTLVIPKLSPKDPVKALKATKLTSRLNGTVKTDTNYRIVISKEKMYGLKPVLIVHLKQTKKDLETIRKMMLSESDIKAARTKALAAIEKQGEDKEKVDLIKAANQAIISIAKAGTKMQVDISRANLTYVQKFLPDF